MANSVQVDGRASEDVCKHALIVPHKHPVSVQCDIFDAKVAAINGIEIDIIFTEIAVVFGQLGRDGVDGNHVVREGQAQGVKRLAGKYGADIFNTNEELIPQRQLLTANAGRKGAAPQIPRFNIGLIQVDIVFAAEIIAAKIPGTKIFAPNIIGVEFNKRAYFLREIGFHIQARALFNEAVIANAVHAEIVAANTDAAADFHVLQFGYRNTAEAGYQRDHK